MAERPKNIILVVVDTLRADHLGCFGYERDTSPNLDRLAAEGALGEQLYCAGIPTPPSFTTIFTGQHPVTHGVVALASGAELAKDAPYLSQVLLEEGYTTCAVDNLLRMKHWFGRGWEYYIDPSVRHQLLCAVSAEELNNRAIPWLRGHADESCFLFIHYWDPHFPLQPPAELSNLFYSGNPVDPNNHGLDEWWANPLGLGMVARETWLRRSDGYVTDPAYVEALYDQEVRHVDQGIGRLLETIDDLGQRDATLVMVLADHGESMTEHGIYFEHHGLYDNVIHVPLLVRWPGHIPAGLRLPHMLQTNDLAPTLLEAAGIDVPFDMDGESIWPLLSGATRSGGRQRIVSCESTWQAKWCLRTDRHKFILARRPDMYGRPDRELYDLQRDPAERHNLVEAEPALATQLERELEQWIADRLAEAGREEDPVQAHGTSVELSAL